MKPTEQSIEDAAALEYREFPTEVAGSMNYNKDVHCFKKRKAFGKGAQWAISQMQPEWVAINSFLTVIENGLSEHIALLKEVNKGNQYNNIDMWDYQTVAESNEAIVELRRLFPQPPKD